MDPNTNPISPETIDMIVKSVTRDGEQSLSELEAERLLNAIARVQSGVATGSQNQLQRKN